MRNRVIVRLAGLTRLPGLIVFLFAMAALLLYSRPVVSLLVRAMHGGSLPPRMWVRQRPSGAPLMITRTQANLALPDSPAVPIKFLGAQSYIAGVGAPFWNTSNPAPFLKRESNCSLTEYSGDPKNFTISVLMKNYQDVLHAQAGLTTTANEWPDGCTDSRLGLPSNSAAIEQTRDGIFYGAVAMSYGVFSEKNAISVRIANSDFTSLGSPTTYALPGTPASLTSADLNGDGKPDLVVVSYDANNVATLSVFLGNGDGTYQTPRKDYPTQLVTVGVTVAPLTSDGAPALIVVGTPSSGVKTDPGLQVFLNNGKGVFGSPVNGPALPGFNISYAAVADFNHDGNADIATNGGHILLGDGTGKFTLMAGLQFAAANNLVAADFDHDGKIDIATTNASLNTVQIYLGNGDGTFTPGAQYSSIFGSFNIGVSDLDGDGNPDLIVGTADPHGFGPGSGTASYAYFLLGRGDGTFAGAPSYVAGLSENGSSYALADFNDDRKPDIVTVANVAPQGPSLYTLTGKGDGTFTPGASAALLQAPVGGLSPLVLSGDFNGDTNNDAILGITTQSPEPGISGSGDLAVFLGHGNDTFGSEIDTPLSATVGAIVTGNFNGDSNLDVIAGGTISVDDSFNPTAGAVFFFAGKGNGMFAAPVPIATPLNPVSFAATDLNGDQMTDLVIADNGAPFVRSPIEGSVKVYLGRGNGTFQSPFTLSAPDHPTAVTVADVNNDGNPDIVVLSSPNTSAPSFVSTVYVFLGDGHGSFGTAIPTKLDEIGDGLAIADLNGDSIPDLAIASCCGFANTEVLPGKGDGTFAAATELPIGLSSSYPTIADLNGDKALALLVSTGLSIVPMLDESGASTPTPSATPTPGGRISISANPVVFPNAGLGGAPTHENFLIQNLSAKRHLIGNAGTPSAPFTFISGGGAFDLAPLGMKKVKMLFTPSAIGLQKGSLTVTSDDKLHPSVTVNLRGTGVPGHLVTNIPVSPLSLEVLSFGPVLHNGGIKSLSFKIKNIGKGQLAGTVETPVAPFLVTTGLGAFSLAPGTTKTITAQFAPRSVAKFSVPLLLTVTPPGRPVAGIAVTLKGRGT